MGFISDNEDELKKNFEHHRTGVFPSGIGGLGEVKFIKDNPSLFGYFVVYHGITTMLRIGDFSLYSPNSGIIAVGELKSEKVGDNLKVHAILRSKVNLKGTNSHLLLDTEEAPNVLNKDKLRKQIATMEKLLEKTVAPEKIAISSSSLLNLIQEPKSKKQIVKTDVFNQFIAISIAHPRMPLSRRIMVNRDDFKADDFIASEAKRILEPKRPYNRIYIGSVDHKMSLGRLPLSCWNVSYQIKEKLLFRELSVITLFNPAEFFSYYTSKGYNVIEQQDRMNPSLQIDNGSMRITIGGVGAYFDLIINNFMSYHTVISMINEVMNLQNDVSNNTKIDLAIFQKA